MRKTILATLVMIILVASIVFGAIQLPGLKLNTEQIQDQEKPAIEEAKLEEVPNVLSVAKKLEIKENNLFSNGAVCKLGNECASGFCKCTCVKSEVKNETNEKPEEIKEEKPTQKNESNVSSGIKLLALTAKLTLNLPAVKSEEKEEVVNKSEEVSPNPIVQDKGLKIAIKQEVKEECESGIYDCTCSACVKDNDCGTGLCVNGECKDKEVQVEKSEINALCNTNDDCKSGNCQERKTGGFFGLGGRIEKKCAETTLEQAKKAIEKKAVSMPLKTSTVNTLLNKLISLEKKMQDLEDKAVKDKLVTRNQLEERCPNCHNIPLFQDEASLTLRKKNVEKRLSILNDILTNKGTLSLEQSKKIKQTMNLNKKIVSEVKPKNSGFLKIFGFVTKIIPTGMFTKITGKVMDDPLANQETMNPGGGRDINAILEPDGMNNNQQGGRQPSTGCNSNNICEPQYQETWRNCMVDCHCGNNVCQLGWNENTQNCPNDCDIPQVCGDGLCTGEEELLANCPQDCPTCGDDVCEPEESGIHGSCRADCGSGICENQGINNENDPRFNPNAFCSTSERGNCMDCCGDFICDGGVETRESCPTDCHPENAETCSEDCADCGDGTCNGNENLQTCALDCDTCGNGYCGRNEDCNADCGPICGNNLCEEGETDSCAECRNINYYKTILSEMFDSLRGIEDRLCQQNSIKCPSGKWQNIINEPKEEKPQDRLFNCITNKDCQGLIGSVCKDGSCVKSEKI